LVFRANRLAARRLGREQFRRNIGPWLAVFRDQNRYGIAAPKGMPPEIVDKLNKTVNAAFEDPQVKAAWPSGVLLRLQALLPILPSSLPMKRRNGAKSFMPPISRRSDRARSPRPD